MADFVLLPPPMMKKKFLPFAIFLLLVVAGYYFTALAFPKNLNRYPALVILFLLDFYVWGLFKKKVFTYSNLIKYSTALIYWMPLVLLAVLTTVMLFVPGKLWAPWLRNLLFGTVFTFYVAKVFVAVILFLTDIVRLTEKFIRWFKKRRNPAKSVAAKPITRRSFLENMALVTGGLIVSSMFMGMFRWVHDFNLRHQLIRIPSLPLIFQSYKIVQLSDLHLGTWSGTAAMEEAVNLINEQNPDLIVFTGDLVNYSTDEAYRFKETLSGLKATDGIYAVLGNHDYGDYINWNSPEEKQRNMEDLYGFYQSIGWKLLRNEHHIIEKGQDRIAVIGVENWSQNNRFPRLGNVLKARKGMGKVSARILLSHDPSHWEAVVIKENPDIDLTLSGHTHGFQFGIEIPGLKWSPAQYIYKQWAGLYENETTGQKLYVNRGLGSIGYPGRIGILPEITIFELQSTEI